MRQTMNTGDWLRLGALSLLWGGSFLFYRMLAKELPPLSTVFGRVSIGAVVLLVLLVPRTAPIAVPRTEWAHIVGLAVLSNALPFSMFAWAETRITGGTAAILNAMTPMFSILVGALLWSEKLTAARIAGVACGLAGVIVLIGPDALIGQDMLGQAACLLAALSYGFGSHFVRRITGVTPPNIALGQLIAGALMLLPLFLVLDRPWTLPAPSATGWIALLGIGVLSTAFAFLLFFDLVARVGGANTVLVTLLVPVTAIVLGAIVLGEPVTWNALAGMALIAAGLAAIDGRLLRRLTRPAPARHDPPAPPAPEPR
jgi:drug/metabolite transporter (DMT)-like permease